MGEVPNTQSPKHQTSYCGLGNHKLRPPHRLVKDQSMLKFAQNINPELRSTTYICGVCYDALKKLYIRKIGNLIQLNKKKATSTLHSFSDVSSSQQMSQQSISIISGELTVPSSTTIEEAPTTSAFARRSKALPTVDEVPSTSSGATSSAATSSGATSSGATNSAATSSAAKRQRRNDDSDDDFMLSLNAVNGTRLPHIQPIPKRRPTVHLNPAAMDIYLAGTTGG